MVKEGRRGYRKGNTGGWGLPELIYIFIAHIHI